ncbi:putative pyridoxine 5'-phosphate oxidase superfamily flavin-nucleotide-binding protein [Bradyrhizobium sp. USDA 4461]
MVRAFTMLTFTDSVKAAQSRRGSREFCASLETKSENRVLDERSGSFISECDSFLLGTANRDGWPHVQHRGGPKGFLRVLGPTTLAFADYSGNQQYITVGNLSENNRLFIFIVDYRQRRRLKVWGRGVVVEDDRMLLARVEVPDYGAKAERAIVVHVEAWDFNCGKHFPER